MKPDHLQKMADKLSSKFHKLHGAVAEIIKKLLVKQRSQACKDRVMSWMRKAVGLNLELQKTMTQAPVAP